MPMQKSHISQQGASSGPRKHKATGRVLFRFWWCNESGNVQFPHGQVLAFILLPVRSIKAAMQKLCISAHPFSTWIVSWSWDKQTGSIFPSIHRNMLLPWSRTWTGDRNIRQPTPIPHTFLRLRQPKLVPSSFRHSKNVFRFDICPFLLGKSNTKTQKISF